MSKWMAALLLIGVMFFPLQAGAAKSSHSDGTIDNSTGLTNKDLVYRDFEITEDGFVTGYIVNTSSRALKSVRLDMWTTNSAETRIFWRKTLSIGDIAPNSKFLVKEPYSPAPEDPAAILFKFRLPGNTNYRN